MRNNCDRRNIQVATQACFLVFSSLMLVVFPADAKASHWNKVNVCVTVVQLRFFLCVLTTIEGEAQICCCKSSIMLSSANG